MVKINKDKLFFLFTFFIIGFFIFLSYSNSFKGEFVFDDIYTVVKNPVIRNWKNISGIFYSAPSRLMANYSFAINYQISGLGVVSYHFLNIFIHFINSSVIFFFVNLLLRKANLPIQKNIQYSFSLAAALFFAVHPVQTQAVSYISQRYSLLAVLFYLLTLYFYLKSFSAPFSWRFFSLSIFSGILALFTKENTFTLPLALILVDYFFISSTWKKLSKRLLFLAPFFFITLVIYFWWFPPLKGGVLNLDFPQAVQDIEISRFQYFLTQLSVYLTYLRLLILPLNQNADYDYAIIKTINQPIIFISLIVIISSIIFAIKMFKKNRLITFGILFFMVTLLSESSVIPIADVVNEHRLYLPFFGFALFLTSIIFSFRNFLIKKKNYVPYLEGFIIIFIMTLTMLTYQRNKIWQTEEAFWKDVVSKSPKKARAHYNLGLVYDKKKRQELAVDEYQMTISLEPKYIRAYNNLATIYEEQGKVKEAEEMYLKALSLDRDNEVIKSNLERLSPIFNPNQDNP